MDIESLKIYGANAITFFVSFTNIEMILKIVLLLVTIGYTSAKWYEIHKRNNS